MSRFVYTQLGRRLDRPEVWERYYDYLKGRRRRPATLRSYRRTLPDGFWPWMERRGKGWHQATPRLLEAYLARRASPHSPRPYLSDNTKHNESVVILRFYRWAADTKLLPTNRLAGVDAWPAAQPVERALEVDDVRSLLVWVAGDSRLEVAVWLAYGCGLRVGELAALRVEHIVLHGARPHLRVVNGKGGKSRTVPLAAPVVEVMVRHLAGRPGTGPVLESHREGRDDGRPVTANTVSRWLSSAMHEAGLPDSAHALRHTFATLLLAADKGRNLYAVSKLLGHSRTDTTERTYVNSYAGPLDETVALLPDPRGNADA